MKQLALVAGAMLLGLAACNPTDSVPEAHAEVRAASAVALWPQPAADAQDGAVHEYY